MRDFFVTFGIPGMKLRHSERRNSEKKGVCKVFKVCKVHKVITGAWLRRGIADETNLLYKL